MKSINKSNDNFTVIITFIAFLSITLFLSFFAVNAWALPVTDIPVSLKDKSGVRYDLFFTTHLRKGRGTMSYVLKSQENPEDKIVVFSGTYDGVSGTCDRYKLLDIKSSVDQQKYVVKDFNDDDWTDIGLFVSEFECGAKTRFKKRYRKIILFATKNGFKLKKEEGYDHKLLNY